MIVKFSMEWMSDDRILMAWGDKLGSAYSRFVWRLIQTVEISGVNAPETICEHHLSGTCIMFYTVIIHILLQDFTFTNRDVFVKHTFPQQQQSRNYLAKSLSPTF